MPKKISLLILAITAIVCARSLFFFFDDPEGTNLLVTTVITLFVYLSSLAITYTQLIPWIPKNGLIRLLLTVGVQIVIVIGLYFCLR
jgi:hypothetical protein